MAPGFVNMMSRANESLIEDGRSQSDIRQGVTLEIMGEGELDGATQRCDEGRMIRRQGDIRYDIEWTTLGSISNISSDVASRRTWRRSSAPPRLAGT